MNCRIIYKDSKIDHVQAENGERSILFDSLKDIFGAEKALELYALTEEDGYKQKIQEKVRSFVGVTEKQIDKLSEAIDAQETLNKLVETGLADNVYQMTSEEIEAKLVELGVEADVAKQVAQSGGYYSNANTAFANLKDKNVKNVQGWMKALTDVQKNGGIKNVNQELEWIGLEDYLNNYVKENNPKAGNIPSSVVEDYIKSNQIEIVDVTKGNNIVQQEIEDNSKRLDFIINELDNKYLFDESGNRVHYIKDENLPKEAVALIIEREELKKRNRELLKLNQKDTKYSGYQLKGAENYREVLLTVPKIGQEKNRQNQIDFVDSLKKKYNVNTVIDLDKVVNDEERTKWEELTTKANISPEKDNKYFSSHWEEANILAHVRLNEKTLPDGRKVLIVNEIQSDWAQQGRKEGFKRTKQAQNELIAEHRKVLQDLEELDVQIIDAVDNKKPNILELGEKKAELIKKSDELRSDIFKPRAPQMPYKNTDQWTGIVVRRVMQMASQEGYDGIAFATGQQSADMYSLSNQVEVLYYKKNEDGTYEVDADLKNGDNRNIGESVTEDKLADYVGKEVANKIIAGEGTNSPSRMDEGYKFLKGLELEVGGEGMKTFYDKIVPKVVQKEAQRFDKNAKLETVDFSDNFTFSKKELDDYTNYLLNKYNLDKTGRYRILIGKNATTEEVAKYKNLLENFRKDNDSKTSQGDKLSLGVQPYLPLTQAIKDSVNQGIPQFQKSGITPITNGFIYKNDVYLNKNADESTMVHEFNHLYNNWLKQNRPEVYKKGLDLIKEELKKKNSEIQDIINFVKTNQPKLEGDALLEEIITEMVGRKGLELLNEQKDKVKSSGIIDYLKQVWQEIKNMLGLSSYTDEQILNMNLQDFANASAVDLLSGENIGRFSTDSNDIRFSQTIPTFKGNADIERIKKLNKKGNEDGATFNLDGSTYDKGGLIIPVISLNTTQKELSKELIEKFIQENSSKIGADNIKVGIFKFEDSNEVSIDLNVVVDAKYRDIGLTFGKYAGQESLFDLSTFLPAKTGADGKNPKNFTDEEFRDIANSLSEGKLPSFLNLSPQTSTNYANLTEDGEGNFVFYHVGGKGYDVIKRGTGQNTATSREEATAINRVGGVAMYYPAENVQESMFSGEAKYLVKVPQEKVYDFNRDTLNLLDEAEQMFRKQFPNQAFDKNSKLAFVTKIANEKGFDAVVANWDNTTRVQTTKELKPLDEQITEGNKIVKDFSAENKFKSNKDKGWQVVPTVMQSKLLKDVYDKIDTLVGNDFSNPLYRVREMAGYTFEDRFAPFKSQDEITDVVEKSDLPQEVKDEYNQAVNSKDKLGYSKLTKKPSLKIDIREVNGRLVVETLVNETKAGALRMLPYEDGYKVESVIVYDKYQNRRLGTRLYQEAIKFLLKSQTPLYSLKVRSENAKKIWDKFVEIGVAQKVGEDYIAPNKGGLDKNNEANPSDVMQYANTTDEKLSKEETAEAIDLTVSLGVESSQEAVAILKDTFLENNSFVFDKKKMKKSGFNDYEITKILVDVNLQNQIKNNLAKLENMDFSVPLMDVQTTPEIGIFGKQKVKPKVKTVNVKTVNEQGEVIDKVSDTKELLRKTYPDTLPTEIPQIISSLLKASESVVNKYNDLFYNTLDDLKDVALDLGVDLKDIENRVFPLENFKSFVNSLMNYYTNPSDAFAEVYDEFFENYGVEKATKPTISTPYTEYELFDKFNLVRNGDEYVKVEDVEIEPSAERQAKIPQLEVEDFAVDFDKLEKLVYHKEQLGVEMKTLQKPLVEEINLREVKKNPYLKATSEGVKLVSEDPLTAQKAELYGYEPKVAEKQPKKIETDYSLIQDVLVTQLTSENKVRTPKGNFTKFMDDNNKSVFLLDGSKQSTVDLEGYLSKADNTPKIEAKKLYSKEEYENNFGCLN